MKDIHPGLTSTNKFENQEHSELFNQVIEKGYAFLETIIDSDFCKQLVDDLEILRGKFPYNIEKNNLFKGVFRSPFIFFNSYRDLALIEELKKYLNEFFPNNYQLHLNRCVESRPSQNASTNELHRDIPYLHTPSKYPISLSVLTFLDDYSDRQISIYEGSHNQYFYNLEGAKEIKLNPKAGQSLIFDSNLIHNTHPTNKAIKYNLFMFTSPIIKPIVEYSSPNIFLKISENKHRYDEILEIIGYRFAVPKDDFEYLNPKLNDL